MGTQSLPHDSSQHNCQVWGLPQVGAMLKSLLSLMKSPESREMSLRAQPTHPPDQSNKRPWGKVRGHDGTTGRCSLRQEAKGSSPQAALGLGSGGRSGVDDPRAVLLTSYTSLNLSVIWASAWPNLSPSRGLSASSVLRSFSWDLD